MGGWAGCGSVNTVSTGAHSFVCWPDATRCTSQTLVAHCVCVGKIEIDMQHRRDMHGPMQQCSCTHHLHDASCTIPSRDTQNFPFKPFSAAYVAEALKTEVDWRTNGLVTPAKDQGAGTTTHPNTPMHKHTNPPYPHQPTPRTLARAQVLTGIVGRLGGLPQQRGNTHASEATVRSPPMPSLVTPIDSSVGRRHRFPMLHTCTHAHTRSHTLAHANTSSHNTHAHAHTHRTQRVVQLPCRPSQLFRGGTRRLHWMGP
jgi:hypothetical protein